MLFIATQIWYVSMVVNSMIEDVITIYCDNYDIQLTERNKTYSIFKQYYGYICAPIL